MRARAQCEARSFAYLSTANYNFFPHVAQCESVGPIATLPQRCHVDTTHVGVCCNLWHAWHYKFSINSPDVTEICIECATAPLLTPVSPPLSLFLSASLSVCLSGWLIAHYLFKALILFTKNVRKISASRQNAFYGLQIAAGGCICMQLT